MYTHDHTIKGRSRTGIHADVNRRGKGRENGRREKERERERGRRLLKFHTHLQ